MKEIEDEELKRLFDMVVHSLDFGSGFLETDDVNLLRKIAKQIGVDPWEGTPSDFKSQYNHDFAESEPNKFWPGHELRCRYCGTSPDAPCHKGEARNDE